MARDYKRELATEKKNHPERVTERAQRNLARRKLKATLKTPSALKGMQVEHVNGRTSDNRLSNLRVVTPKDNNQGRHGGPATSSRKRKK